MSYYVVKGINLVKKDKKVLITCADSSLTPLSYDKEEWKSFSDIFKKEGEEGVIKEILYNYWTGNFQAGTKNDYWKVAKLFDKKSELFSHIIGNKEYDFRDDKDLLKEDLWSAWQHYKNLKKQKGKFAIRLVPKDPKKKLYHNLVLKATARKLSLTYSFDFAKHFKTKVEAIAFIDEKLKDDYGESYLFEVVSE